MIGGGKGAFIGAIHRAAALMDNQIELVCGCFSSKPEVSLASGREYFLPDDRIYTSYQQMIEREAALPEERRMDFVSIVTRTNCISGRPRWLWNMASTSYSTNRSPFSLEEAYRLRDKVEQTGRTLALTHTYSGYPGVKEARERFARGDFGKIRKIFVEYTQGWLSTRVELDPASNAGWRTDPSCPEKRERWEISALMPCNWPNTSPGSDAHRSAPTCVQSWKDACSTTTARHCSVSTEAPPACWSQPR